MRNNTLARIRRILLTVGLSSAMMANAALPAFAVTSIGNDVTVGGNLTVTTGSSLGIVTAGTWNGTAIAVANGGTGAVTAGAALTNLGAEAAITAGTTSQYWRGDKTWQTLDKTAVGLANVVNADTTTTANITDSLNKRFLTDAQLAVVGATSGTNTGDETTATIKTKLGAATTLADGYLTAANWNTFNSKQNALTAGVDYLAPNGNGSALTSLTGANVTGTVANATNAGNATTVTNGVYTTGSYADPAWITSLASGKLTGALPAISGAALTGLLGSQISGNIAGNAANVTGTVAVANGGTGATTLTGLLKGNGVAAFTAAVAGTDFVDPSASYADPAWITSLAASKLTGALPAVSGAALTSLTGANVTGTVANATSAVNFSGGLAGNVTGTQGATVISSLPAISGAALTGLNASNIAQGTGSVNLASFDGTLMHLDSGTNGPLTIGTGGSAKTITLGAWNHTLILSGATVNVGTVGVAVEPSTVNIANTSNATGTQIVSIGSSAKAANAVTIAAGSTGNVNINGTLAMGANNITGSGTVAASAFTGNLTGNVTGNLSGNAATVTNGVYTTGSYADPAWITSLAAGKLTGAFAITGGTIDGTAIGSTTRANGAFSGLSTLNEIDIGTTIATEDVLHVKIATGGAARFNGVLSNVDLTADRTWALPDVNGQVVTTGNLASVTGTGVLTSGATGAGFTVDLGASTVSGVLGIANGGTGTTTANAALNALLPAQATNAGKFLTTNGTNAAWAFVTAAAGGADKQLQFNDGGTTIAGAAGLNWDKVAGNLGIGDSTPAALLTVGSGDLFTVDTSGNVGTTANLTVAGHAYLGDATSDVTTVAGVLKLSAAPMANVVDSTGAMMLRFAPSATPVNYVQMSSGDAGQSVVVAAQGSDANVTLYLAPKGTGVVRVGGVLNIDSNVYLADGADRTVSLAPNVANPSEKFVIAGQNGDGVSTDAGILALVGGKPLGTGAPGYVRVGDTFATTPNLAPFTPFDLFVEGKIEVDGMARFDGTTEFTQSANFSAASPSQPFYVTSEIPVPMLNASPRTYQPDGTQVASPKVVTGTVTLTAGTATVTLLGSAQFPSNLYVCTATDTTAPNAVSVSSETATSFVVTGTGTDVINFICIGK